MPDLTEERGAMNKNHSVWSGILLQKWLQEENLNMQSVWQTIVEMHPRCKGQRERRVCLLTSPMSSSLNTKIHSEEPVYSQHVSQTETCDDDQINQPLFW